MADKSLKIKDPHGNNMDYKVQPIKVMTMEQKEMAKAKAKAAAKPAISGQKKAKKK